MATATKRVSQILELIPEFESRYELGELLSLFYVLCGVKKCASLFFDFWQPPIRNRVLTFLEHAGFHHVSFLVPERGLHRALFSEYKDDRRFQAFLSFESKPEYRLLISSEKSILNDVRGCKITADRLGSILGFPPCCRKVHDVEAVQFTIGFYRSLIEHVGNDSIEEMLQVMKWDQKFPDKHGIGECIRRGDLRTQKTKRQYPFVLHTACEACLSNAKSPTSVLDAEYRKAISKLGSGIGSRIAFLANTFDPEGRAIEPESQV